MKKKMCAVRSVIGWLLLAASVVLAAWAALTGWKRPERTEYAATGRSAQVESIPVQTGLIPVNAADAALLDELPGVGPATAESIIAEREANGPFYYPENLLQVPGIGEKKLNDMRDMLDLTEE